MSLHAGEGVTVKPRRALNVSSSGFHTSSAGLTGTWRHVGFHLSAEHGTQDRMHSGRTLLPELPPQHWKECLDVSHAYPPEAQRSTSAGLGLALAQGLV